MQQFSNYQKILFAGLQGTFVAMLLLFSPVVWSAEVEKVDLTQKDEPVKRELKWIFDSKERARQAQKARRKKERAAARWEKILEKTKSVLTLVHNDQFVFKIIPMQENFYLPKAALDLSPIPSWQGKLSRHFAFTDGPSVLIHVEKYYYDREGVVYPNYVFQLNLEVPENLFRNGLYIPVEELKGYLAWVNPDFPHGDLFLHPSSGHLFLWRVKKGVVMGRLDMKFEHAELTSPIHLYGKVRAYRMTKEEYAAWQDGVRAKIMADSRELDRVPVHRDRLRPQYEYKLWHSTDPWVKGRSSNLWETVEDKKEGLKP